MSDDALEMTRLIPDFGRAEALARLVEVLPASARDKLLDEASGLPENCRSDALVALAKASDIQFGRRVLGAVKQIDNNVLRRWAMTRVAPALPEPLCTEAAAATFQEIDVLDWFNSDNVTKLAVALPPQMAVEALDRIRTARGSQPHLSHWEVIGALATRLARCGQPRVALDAVLRIEDPGERSQALDPLAAELPLEMLKEVRAAIGPTHSPKDWITARAAVADHLTPDRVERILRGAADLAEPSNQVDALIQLADRLTSPSVRKRAYEAALAALPEIRIPNPGYLLAEFEALLAKLPEVPTQAAITLPDRIPDPKARLLGGMHGRNQVRRVGPCL